MQKPTSELNFQIIEYLMHQSHLKSLLAIRDQEKRTFGVEVACKFFKRNPNDSSRSAYYVDFIYDVNSNTLEKTDDVSVTVEVKEGTPPSFEILHIRVY